MFSLVACRQLT